MSPGYPNNARSSTTGTPQNDLNPAIRGWSNYYATVVSTEIYSLLDTLLYRKLWRWAKFRHPKQGKRWIANRYWLVGSKDGRSVTGTSNYFVMPKRLFIAMSKSKERHPPMTGTGHIGVKDGVHTLESAQKSQPPSNGKKVRVLNVGFTSI